jgi:hypothetical protein
MASNVSAVSGSVEGLGDSHEFITWEGLGDSHEFITWEGLGDSHEFITFSPVQYHRIPLLTPSHAIEEFGNFGRGGGQAGLWILGVGDNLGTFLGLSYLESENWGRCSLRYYNRITVGKRKVSQLHRFSNERV